MRVEILQNGAILQTVHHGGQNFAMAPVSGFCVIRLTNDAPRRRLAVVSVDGINVLELDKDGRGATHSGPGYVLGPHEVLDIPGWHRSNNEVASFDFVPKGKSYTEGMGRGESSRGVIGVAVFDDVFAALWGLFEHRRTTCRPVWRKSVYPCRAVGGLAEMFSDQPPELSLPTDATEDLSRRLRSFCSTQKSTSGDPPVASIGHEPPTISEPIPSVGIGYGQAQAFHTTSTTFERATKSPAEVVVLRYATREQLESWGVPLPGAPLPAPAAFPGQQGASCPAPPGWRG